MKACVCLLVLSGVLFFYRLGDRDLTSSHEARAAQDAQTVLTSGDWLLPRLFDGKLELQKPPLYYWLVALSAWLSGGAVDAWAVRLPAAGAALATVLLLFFFGWKSNRPLAGLLAGVVLATCLHFTWLARVGRIDMPLTFAVSAALIGFYLGRERRLQNVRAWPWLVVAYLSVAVGILLKGPIAAVLPGIVVIATLIFERSSASQRGWRFGLGRMLRIGRDLSMWWGIPLVLLVSAPWFLWANARTGGVLFRVFFWYHNVQRGLGGAEALQARPWWFYGPRLAIDLAPWSVLLPLTFWALWRQQIWKLDSLARFGAIWFVSMLLLLSCMRFKRADYLLPAYPGAALLLGAVGERCWREGACGFGRWALRLAGVCCLSFVVAGLSLGWWIYIEHIEPVQDAEHAYPRFAQAIRERSSEIVVFFRAEAHNLAFHLGPPQTSLLEWENLDWWVARPERVYVILPPDCAATWQQHLISGSLEPVLQSTDFGQGEGERPLVLMRTKSGVFSAVDEVYPGEER